MQSDINAVKYGEKREQLGITFFKVHSNEICEKETLLRHFTIKGQENSQIIIRYYTVGQSKHTEGKRSHKMAGLNDPNFDL